MIPQNGVYTLLFSKCDASGLVFPKNTDENKEPELNIAPSSLVAISHLVANEEAKWAKAFAVKLPNGNRVFFSFDNRDEEYHSDFNHGAVYQTQRAEAAVVEAAVEESDLISAETGAREQVMVAGKIKGSIDNLEPTVLTEGSKTARVDREVLSQPDIMDKYTDIRNKLKPNS